MWPFASSSKTKTEDIPPSACPVDHTTRQKWLEQNPSAEGGPSRPSSQPASSSSPRSRRLSEEREISTIPRHRGPSTPPSSCPNTQASTSQDPSTNPNWVYPSPSQFQAALQRKGRDTSSANMEIVVPIHNAVNERAWSEILSWEHQNDQGQSFTQCGGPKLVSFQGKPKEVTWKAWMKQVVGYQAPFDRHDWTIDRCGHRVRYIIDFYAGKGSSSPFGGGPNSGRDKDGKLPMPKMNFYLDVRPAPDTLEGVMMRVRKFGRDLFGLGGQQSQQATTSPKTAS